MSFKTYHDYNSDNINKAIERYAENDIITARKPIDPIERMLKGALNVRIRDDNGIAEVYERLVNGRWFRWSRHESITHEEFKGLIRSLDKTRYTITK